jgi:hypothetical protein
MTSDDEVMTDEEKGALAEVHNLHEPTSRWDNAPGDIVMTKRGDKDDNIPL